MQDAIARFVQSQLFKTIIIVIILLAGVLVGFQTDPLLVSRYDRLFTTLESAIVGIFVIEFILKVIAEKNKPWRYFYDPWNVFDFIILVACFLPINGKYVMVLRMARLLRVIKLVRALPRLQILVEALFRSLPSMGYVSLLMCLLFYIYGVAATFMFGENDPIHFRNLGIAILSMFRAVTLEDWTDIMYIQMYGCDRYGYDGQEALCTNPEASPILGAIFFSSFILIGAFVIINLLIGVMTNSVEESHKAQQKFERQLFLSQQEETLHVEKQLSDLQEQLSVMQESIEQIKRNLPQPSKRRK
ncbi:MAG: ion transporter [Cyanobacteria bacterium SBLK]|nr:ion transporter [Cyanobacteria bacterium SBLK]